ncbi:MAG: bifunctional 4-hydroxy-2-oxoglutarate aldolase/2-dehydro-3-deoxy-phosphogluconate aldolase [Ruminococcaceae bacterium]|nr:bifunctional 4-hydroxy-2-oxoglutarate aldolase/2-dehydro-3-deoxy-phosphogluconate aldolase [Oscillospiraceae bacterium]
MFDLENTLRETGIVPVIKISDANRAADLAKALCAGGMPAAEVTFRTAAAADAIYKMREAFPGMTVGAGTVLTKASLDDALAAGAQFIVAPGLNPSIVEACLAKDVPVVPGCMTPSEMELAMAMGLTFVKFFPAEAAGGVKFLKAVSAPYAGLKFMPTGGISMKNAADYLALPYVVCCGASFIASDEQITGGRFDEIEEAARQAKVLADTVRGH